VLDVATNLSFHIITTVSIEIFTVIIFTGELSQLYWSAHHRPRQGEGALTLAIASAPNMKKREVLIKLPEYIT